MPVTPTHNHCAMYGCKEPKSKLNSYCMAHGGKENSFVRQSDSMYKTPVWRSIRRRQMSLQPLCQACLCRGIVCSAWAVDHVFPWRSVGGEAFTHNIFQSLCQPCHSHKTGLERHGICEQYDGVVKQHSIDDYAYAMLNQS
jgi:5-methylcytosine-specific restriction protein A